MRVAFDENVPSAMVRLFQILSKENQLKWLSPGLTIESAADYTPKQGDADYVKNDDVPWIKRFSAAGGKVIISGNTDMKRQSHERLALVQEEMVAIFFEGQWSKWKSFRKCALLLHWWPVIVKTVKTAKPGTFWHIPADWPADWEDDNNKLRAVSNKDTKLTKIERQIAARETVRARRKARIHAAAQASLDFEGGEK